MMGALQSRTEWKVAVAVIAWGGSMDPCWEYVCAFGQYHVVKSTGQQCGCVFMYCHWRG